MMTNTIVGKATTVLNTIMATEVIIYIIITIAIGALTIVKNWNYHKRHNSYASRKIIMNTSFIRATEAMIVWKQRQVSKP